MLVSSFRVFALVPSDLLPFYEHICVSVPSDTAGRHVVLREPQTRFVVLSKEGRDYLDSRASHLRLASQPKAIKVALFGSLLKLEASGLKMRDEDLQRCRTRQPRPTRICRNMVLFQTVLLFLAWAVAENEAFNPWQQSLSRHEVVSRFATKKEESSSQKELWTTPSPPANGKEQHGHKGKSKPHRKMELMWCGKDYCKESIRERMVDEHVVLNGPATGQVAYYWNSDDEGEAQQSITRYVLLFVRPGDDELLKVAADAIKEWTSLDKQNATDDQIHVMLDPTLAARLEHNYGVRSECIHLFEPKPTPGFGSHLTADHRRKDFGDPWDRTFQEEALLKLCGDFVPDLIVTLGGDGQIMHAGMLFQGPMPPVLSVAGGSLGFLTPFTIDEMVDAVRISLGMLSEKQKHALSVLNTFSTYTKNDYDSSEDEGNDAHNLFPHNVPSYPYDPLPKNPVSFGSGARICLSIRMRLCCQIINREGVQRARFNVLNEVVIDRGSSPYLAALECFCDDVHLTTVQADGIIFATPTGSTAYSMAAGGSVVHPAVPCILVTPICPHVLSFRSMVFPDHVVLRCYVPDDARSFASVAFDGKHRQELQRGESVQIRLSAFPVPTLNRQDHSSDWLGSLKQNFSFNTRPRQRPL